LPATSQWRGGGRIRKRKRQGKLREGWAWTALPKMQLAQALLAGYVLA